MFHIYARKGKEHILFFREFGGVDILDLNTNNMVRFSDHSFENFRINLRNLSSSYYRQQFHQHLALKHQPKSLI